LIDFTRLRQSKSPRAKVNNRKPYFHAVSKADGASGVHQGGRVVSNFVRLPAVKVENPKKRVLGIRPINSHPHFRYPRNEKMGRAERHVGSAAVPLCKHEDVRIDCLTAAPIFRGLSQSELYEIANSAQELRFSHRETIFRQGDPVRFIHLIIAGMVKVTDISASGKEVILRVDRKASVIVDVTDALQVPMERSSHGFLPRARMERIGLQGFRQAVSGHSAKCRQHHAEQSQNA
jgi:Cyclic nucleotide-binding domain